MRHHSFGKVRIPTPEAIVKISRTKDWHVHDTPQKHLPVLLNEVIKIARETEKPITRFLDGTFGRGGHFRALLKEFPEATAVGIDRDLDAIEFGKKEFAEELAKNKIQFIRSNYVDVGSLDLGLFDLILLDLGVSSPQLEAGERGFSFYNDGPLDMRMDQRDSLTAAQVVNESSAEELEEIFRKFGEIFKPSRVVNAIVKDRYDKKFTSTKQLADLIARVDGWARKGHHPATRYFMALRIFVNRELDDLQPALEALVQKLSPKGRILVITFHSTEDRIVKYAFKAFEETYGSIVNKKVIKPTWDEQKINPRSRSAQLRAFTRGT